MMSLYILRTRAFLSLPQRNVFRSVYAKSGTNFYKIQYCTQSEKTKGWVTWKGIVTRFVPIGLCLIAVMQWRAYRKHVGKHTAKQWEVNCYCALPLRAVSRCWGWVADKNLPVSLRPFVYKLYISTFGVNINEAQIEDLTLYTSLSELFVRELKEGTRPIDSNNCLVSPCDGTVLHFGPINSGHVEQVKGVTYPLEKFLGEKEPLDKNNTFLQKFNKSNKLYQCVIYLAPGDYHRFHSPTEWNATHRRHIPGELLSVNPAVAKWVPGLFCLNERAVYLGNWKYGLFTFTAVGATNVGSIRVYFDKSLHTNRPKNKYQCKDKCLGSSVMLKKGDPFGEFRMGSTIVLIFEAPNNFQFNFKIGQKLKMGQGIGCVKDTFYVDKISKVPRNDICAS